MAGEDNPIDNPQDRSTERARRFARHVASTFVSVARRAVDLAEIEPGQTVLDVGTATGLVAFLAAERAGRDGSVIGVDASEEMLAIARERSASVGYDYIRWQSGDPSQLNFADESFDAVLCVQALPFVERPSITLEEIRRVLVEQGRLVVTVWGNKAGNEWIGLLEEGLRRGAPGVRPPSAPPLSQPGNVDMLLQAAGFVEIEIARLPDLLRFASADGLWDWARGTRSKRLSPRGCAAAR